MAIIQSTNLLAGLFIFLIIVNTACWGAERKECEGKKIVIRCKDSTQVLKIISAVYRISKFFFWCLKTVDEDRTEMENVTRDTQALCCNKNSCAVQVKSTLGTRLNRDLLIINYECIRKERAYVDPEVSWCMPTTTTTTRTFLLRSRKKTTIRGSSVATSTTSTKHSTSATSLLSSSTVQTTVSPTGPSNPSTTLQTTIPTTNVVGPSSGSRGSNNTEVVPVEKDDDGILIGSVVGGVVFLVLLVTAIVLLVRRYGNRSRNRLEKRMKSSLKDAEKNGSLCPVNREPAFASPYTTEVNLRTLNRVENGGEKNHNSVYQAHYSVADETVDIREVDLSVHHDPMLDFALAQGRSKRSQQGVVQGDARDSAPEYSYANPDDIVLYNNADTDANRGNVPGDYTEINSGVLPASLDSGLPDEVSNSTDQNLANAHWSEKETPEYLELVTPQPGEEGIYCETYGHVNRGFEGDAGDGWKDAGEPHTVGDGVYAGLESPGEENVYTALGGETQGADDGGHDSIYAMESPSTTVPETNHVPDVKVGEHSSYYTLETDNGEEEPAYSLDEGGDDEAITGEGRSSLDKGQYDMVTDQDWSVEEHTDISMDKSLYAEYDDSHRMQINGQNNDHGQSTDEHFYADYDDRPNYGNANPSDRSLQAEEENVYSSCA